MPPDHNRNKGRGLASNKRGSRCCASSSGSPAPPPHQPHSLLLWGLAYGSPHPLPEGRPPCPSSTFLCTSPAPAQASAPHQPHASCLLCFTHLLKSPVTTPLPKSMPQCHLLRGNIWACPPPPPRALAPHPVRPVFPQPDAGGPPQGPWPPWEAPCPPPTPGSSSWTFTFFL